MISGVFDFLSYFYDYFFGSDTPVVADMRKRIVDRMDLHMGDRVLEVAIGTGANVPFIHRKVGKGGEIHGVDISKRMLRKCKDNLKRWGITAHIDLGDAEHLPFKDNEFDAALIFASLKFVKNKEKALKEIVRVTKPGGRIVLGDEYPFMQIPLPENICNFKASREHIFWIKEFNKML